jgi:pimeloyl-ACP methyl ester carboxylesterase
MAEDDAAGPSLMIGGDGQPAIPLYLVSFDKQGRCTSPRTRAAVLADARSGRYTDLHIYSHGWNNVFDEAVRHYTEFFTEYAGLRRAAGLDSNEYRPLLVGLIWPSTALLAPGEEPPRLASIGPGFAVATPTTALEAAALASEMTPDDAARLSALAAQTGPLDGADSVALARLLTPLLDAHASGDLENTAPPADAGSLLLHWSSVQPGAGALAPSGALGFLDPREILRKATVFLMKDRAGTVGAAGVAPLLREALHGSPIRIHLAGHSYGAKVMLAALAKLPPGRQVASLLLLQPAVSARCFAERIAEHNGKPGGYRAALERVTLPVCTTFSRNDAALNSFYPLALRRGPDIGEFEPSSSSAPFAALGGVGPQDMAPGELEVTAMLDQPGVYPPPLPGVRVRALDGASGIGGHGDVRNRFTEWALASLVRQAIAADARV